MVGPAATTAQLDLDTGVAVVNTGNKFAEVTLFVAEDGSEENSTLQLGPGEHRAGFLRELFPSLSEQILFAYAPGIDGGIDVERVGTTHWIYAE